jgi:hypothetical protein
MQHTPGPWSSKRCSDGALYAAQTIANQQRRWDYNTEGDNYERTVEANRLLVLAAPELLEACRLAVAMLEVRGAKYDSDLAIIRAAIRTAEGGES